MLDTETALGQRSPMPASPTGSVQKTGCVIEGCKDAHYANAMCKFHDELTEHGTNMAALRGRRRRVRDGKQVGTRVSLADVATFEAAIEHGLIEGPRLYTAYAVALEAKAAELRAQLEKRGVKSGASKRGHRKKK